MTDHDRLFNLAQDAAHALAGEIMTDHDRLFNMAKDVENAAVECDSVEVAEFLIEIVAMIHAVLGDE